ncbi:MAG: GGDEF domain-containing protein [Planctomycetota bacterium]
MIIDALIALACAGFGMVFGWLGCATYRTVPPKDRRSKTSADGQPLGQEMDPSPEVISEVADKLRSFAGALAVNVDDHQSRVQAVNDSLNESDHQLSPEEILGAVNQLVAANEGMQAQLQSAQAQIHEQALQLESAEKQAATDALTRIANRRCLDDHLAARFSMGHEEAGSLALFDVDHFKQFNDVHGHRAGDEVLRVVASILNVKLQSYGLVARYGGEEFAVVLDGVPIKESRKLVEIARQAVAARQISFEGKQLKVTMCAGIAELSEDESLQQWIQRSDDGLYASKEAGRDCAHWMKKHKPVLVGGAMAKAARGKAAVATKASGKSGSSDVSQAASAKVADPKMTADRSIDREAATSQTGDAQSSGSSARPVASGNVPPTEGTRRRRSAGEQDDAQVIAARNPSEDDLPQRPNPRAFAYLPDVESLNDAFVDLHKRTSSVSIQLCVLAVRFNAEPNAPAMRQLLQYVRGGTTRLDKVGCFDDQTLLLLIPCKDVKMATERGESICQSAEAFTNGQDLQEARAVTVGIAIASDSETLPTLARQASKLAVAASKSGDLIQVYRRDAVLTP